MQPQEFNAFVAAIVSARTALLMTPARAEELIESAASRAGFGPKDKAATCEAIVAGNERVLNISQMNAGDVGKGCWVRACITRFDKHDEERPILVKTQTMDLWLRRNEEVLIRE